MGSLLDERRLRTSLQTTWMGKDLHCYDTISSTNTVLMEMGREGACEGRLLVADQQTKGKGRRGRTWQSPGGNTVSFSLLLRPEIRPQDAPMLTLIMAVCVAETLQKNAVEQVQIKWPNDVLVCEKKVCGILTEMTVQKDQAGQVVIGVGINTGGEQIPPELLERATSLYLETGKEFSREELVGTIITAFENRYERFCEQRDLTFLQEIYNADLVNKDRQVTVLDPQQEYSGIARGINARGELLVELPDGQLRRVYAGEVSVRGIYGYV